MKKEWLGLAALIPGLAIVFMDQTVLPVALPTIQQQFKTGNVALEWAVNAYLLSTAIFVLAAGKISDRIGHRRALILSIVLFALASILCGLSPNIGFLIGARSFQGIGASLLFPSQSALLASLFPPEKRGRAAGLVSSFGSLFLILGPLIGGYLTEMASWRWIFWINLPIAAIGCLMAFLFLPRPNPTPSKIDSRGFSYFAIFASSLTLLLMQGRQWGWTAAATLILYPLIAVSLFLLLQREKKAAQPFLDLTLFKHPVFTAVNISVAAIQFILMVTVFRAIYFQIVLGYTPTETGLFTFIACLPVFFLSPLAGVLADKIAPKFPIAIGFSFLIFSFLWFGIHSVPTLFNLILASVAFGIGIPFTQTPSYSAGLSSVPPKKIGVGSGMMATFRTLGATAGVAILGLIIDSVQKAHLLSLPQLRSLAPSQILAVANDTLPVADATSSLPLQKELTQAVLDARIAAFSTVHYILAALLLLIFAIVFTLHHRKSAHHPPASIAEGWD